jgi:hypothetical protein
VEESEVSRLHYQCRRPSRYSDQRDSEYRSNVLLLHSPRWECGLLRGSSPVWQHLLAVSPIHLVQGFVEPHLPSSGVELDSSEASNAAT